MLLGRFKRLNSRGYAQERAELLTCHGCQETTVVVTERFGDQEYVKHVYPPPPEPAYSTSRSTKAWPPRTTRA